MVRHGSGKSLVRFLAINDVYSLDNLARLKTLFDKRTADVALKTGNQEIRNGMVFKVLAGDFLSPNVLSPIDSGFSFMRCFNAIGMSHMIFGNHEGNVGLKHLEERLSEFRGTLINSNIPTFDRPKLPMYDVIPAGNGVRVGLLGMLTDERKVFRNGKFIGYRIENVIDTARTLEKRLREDFGCKEIVAITHQSMERDRELADATKICAIIGGHEHSPFDETVDRGGTRGVCRIVKQGKDAMACGTLDLLLDHDHETVVSFNMEPVDDYFPDLKIEKLVKSCMDVVRDMNKEVMIAMDHSLTATGTRFRPTDIGRLFNDYIRLELDSEVAMINGATIKGMSDFPDGRVSYAQLQSLLPFPTKLITIDMPGRVLQDAIRYSRQSKEYDDEKRGFLQVSSGVEMVEETFSGRFGTSQTGDYENKTTNDTIVSINGQEFDPNRVYSVTLPRNLLKGFCEIQPLMDYAKQIPGLDEDTYIPAFEVVMRHCAKYLWGQLGDFDDIDIDHDDLISRDELQKRFQQVIGKGPSEGLLDGLMEALDFDEDEFISREEFQHIKQKLG